MHLPDVNFWLALAFESHPHHPAAAAWFQGAEPKLCHFCSFTLLGFLRLVTHPRVLGEEALNMQEAWAKYDAIRDDLYIGFIPEPAGLEPHWRNHTRRRTRSHKVWADAYLAAFAETAGLELVTFDRGFKELRGPKLTLLG